MRKIINDCKQAIFTMIQVRNALEKIADRMAEDKWES